MRKVAWSLATKGAETWYRQLLQSSLAICGMNIGDIESIFPLHLRHQFSGPFEINNWDLRSLFAVFVRGVACICMWPADASRILFTNHLSEFATQSFRMQSENAANDLVMFQGLNEPHTCLCHMPMVFFFIITSQFNCRWCGYMCRAEVICLR